MTDGYYDRVRSDVVAYLPKRTPRVLEIGCGAGATLRHLKAEGRADWVAGVEIVPSLAEEARASLDAFWSENIEAFDPPIEKGSLDAILALDVLEHLVDPWKAAERLKEWLKPGGLLIVSLPNVRSFKVLAPLLTRGRFTYTDGGILDRTHLRFFVRETAISLVTGAGLELKRVEALGIKKYKNKWWIIQLSLGALRDFYALQFLVIGQRPA